MEHIPPRRRGRPPIKQAAAPAEPAAYSVEETPQVSPEAPPKRRRRAKVGGHSMKLQAPSRPGYTRRWVNETGNRIAQMEDLGYDFVSEAGVQSTNVGSRISRIVGTKATGEPLLAYLMETPDELFAEGLSEKEEHVRHIDAAMQAIVDEQGRPTPQGEITGQVSITQDR